MYKNIAILGSTGSIGQSAISVIKNDKNLKIKIIVANKNYRKIYNQIKIFKPEMVIIKNFETFLKIKKKNKNKKIKVFNDYNYLKKIKKKLDYTIAAIPGIAGLEPTLMFTKISKEVLIANKESIVCGWNLLKSIGKKFNTKLTSIDSEHFSISEIIKNYTANNIENIYITASGGPFLNLPFNKFHKIKPNQAIKHPNWKMGKKISVDSATLVNKVLEISEAHKLFPFKLKQYKILIHPESLIHAIVKFKNGTSILLYHEPNMQIPIANALRSKNFFTESKTLKKNTNLNIKKISFKKVDKKKFPIVKIINKINEKKSSLIVFNAANEVFVDQFLKNNIDFIEISRYLELVIKDKNYLKFSNMKSNSLAQIKKIDLLSKNLSMKILKKKYV